MPLLRLFAAAREAAGTASVEVPGLTVDEVLDAARTRFGPELAAVIDASKVWRNGEPASGSDAVGPGDEVAVLPPVSGGSGPDRPSGGRSRPTFTPAEPPPSKPSAPRRSPSAEAAAARWAETAGRSPGRTRRDGTDPGAPTGRAAEARARRAGSRVPEGRGARDPAGDGAPDPAGGPSARAPRARAGRGRPPTGRGAGPGRAGDLTGRGTGERPDRGAGRAGAPPERAPVGRSGADASRRGGDRSGTAGPGRRPTGAVVRRDGTPAETATPARPAVEGPAGRPAGGRRPTARATGRAPEGRRPTGGASTEGPGEPGSTGGPRRVVPATPPPLAPGVLTRTTAPTGRPLARPESEAADEPAPAAPATRLTRMRSLGVPVTGSITVRGKERKVSGRRQRRTALGRRYAVVYDTDGPKVTFGVLWFVALMGSIVLGWWSLTFLVAIAAGWAAMEAADRWRERGVAADPWVAALGAGAVAAAGAAGTGYVGAAILVVVLASVARMALSDMGRDHVLSASGNTVGCAIPFGLAAASVVLANDLEIGAVVALVLFAAAYDAGDYLIGSGSSNSVEGPLTGIVTIGVVAMAIAVLGTPPFEGVPTYTFAAFAAVLCPLGQMAASAILPANDAHAPSVRRLDSLLLLAPVWVWTVGIFMDGR